MLVSVVMSVYNEEPRHLASSIKSILQQSFKNIEFIIINDNPSDIQLDKYINLIKDERVIYLRNKRNVGLAASLNRAIRISKGQYIARMDADDISTHDRISEQVNFMEKNKDVSVLGTNAYVINDVDDIIGEVSHKYTHDFMHASTYFGAPLVHPTVMFRRNFFARHMLYYDDSYKYAQDYELWARAVQLVKFAILDKKLFKWRDNEGRVSRKSEEQQNIFARKVHIRQIERLGLFPDKDKVDLNENLFHYDKISLKELFDVFKWALHISFINDKNKIFPLKEFKRIVAYNFRVLSLNSDNRLIGVFFWFFLKVYSYK